MLKFRVFYMDSQGVRYARIVQASDSSLAARSVILEGGRVIKVKAIKENRDL